MDNLQRYFDKIDAINAGLRDRNSGGSYKALGLSQKHLYDVIKQIAGSDDKKVIRKRDIQNEGAPYFSTEKPLNIRLTDFCYNKVNLDDKEDKFLLSVGRGKVRYVGFDWQNEQEEEITWELEDVAEPFVVGTYHRKFDWKFHDLDQYLKAKRAANELAKD